MVLTSSYFSREDGTDQNVFLFMTVCGALLVEDYKNNFLVWKDFSKKRMKDWVFVGLI